MVATAMVEQATGTDAIKLPQDFKPSASLPKDHPDYVDPTLAPTFDRTGLHVEQNADPNTIVKTWLDTFAKACQSLDAEGFANCFIPEGFYRDKLSLTWKYRTIRGTEKLEKLAKGTLHHAKMTNFKVAEYPAPSVERPYDDLSFIQAHITFDTVAGKNNAIITLVPTTANGSYKAWTVSSFLEELHKYPQLGRENGHSDATNTYEDRRKEECQFNEKDPEVLIIGGGHCGLGMAARLKALGVSSLIIEKNGRVGDNWRKRYSSLCLHMPLFADHMPFLEYPKTWPLYIPAEKMANWLEHYAEVFDLNVWTSCSVLKPKYDTKLGTWSVPVTRDGTVERIFYPKQVVVCPGLAGRPYTPPSVKGEDSFRGLVMHSTSFKTARPFKGKKVVIVGTSSSGFDVAYDCVKNDVDVTIIQRSPTYLMSLENGPNTTLYPIYWDHGAPPLEVADRLSHHQPIHITELLGQRSFGELARQDSELLEAVNKKGLRTYLGKKFNGGVTLGWSRGGGFYFDSGACKHVINDKIKIKPGSIQGFTEDEAVLDNGGKVDADIVIYATGFTPVKDAVEDIMGKTIADKHGDIWGLDDEGELRGVWGNSNVDKFHVMVGTFHWSRLHSKLVAMQVVAEEKGVKWPTYDQ